LKANHSKYIIIGAGLSGLTTAYFLKKQGITDVRILEGRSQIGGRILTHHNIDFGATWFQQPHQYVNSLLTELQIGSFQQYQKGQSVLVYNPVAPAHYFESAPDQASAKRIAGGSIALIDKLAEGIDHQIDLNTKVESIREVNNYIEISSNKGLFLANKVIVTMPPQLANTLSYYPSLPKYLVSAMEQTHTWMSNAIKVGMRFTTPFWREKKYSGTVIGQIGAVTELYDHCNFEENSFSLMGFVNEDLRPVNPEYRKEQILSYLEKYLGELIRDYKDYFEKDWSKDEFTTCQNSDSVVLRPNYGNLVFEDAYMNGKLLFSGTETAKQFGGYLEGAVISGLTTAKHILNTHK
jgi:monoamine oxidase